MARVHGLGRRREWDEANHRFLLPRRAPPPARRKRLWNLSQVLDQGDTPQCVAFSSFHFLMAGPISNRRMGFTPDELYHWAQDRDEWPGSDYEGTSALGAMKALKEKGYVGEYRWALDVPTITNWVLATGPILMGTNWHADMENPDRNGFLHPTGNIEGGHEWCVVGVNLDKKCGAEGTGAIRMVNSWGRSWGEGGRAWISLQALGALLGEEGDAVTPTEVKVGNKMVALADFSSDTEVA